jgi:hypothetical protein
MVIHVGYISRGVAVVWVVLGGGHSVTLMLAHGFCGSGDRLFL